MNNNGYYPSGADVPEAPWNDEELPEKEIDVEVTVVLTKVVKVKVNDYEIIDQGKDESGEYFEDIDYSNCNLREAVLNQTLLPHEGYIRIPYGTKAFYDLKDWELEKLNCELY